ncbi:MAG: MBL fold metallo-hydrolase [Bacteroidales bacterium]|nr:MBL fold metallo-hydrolase [Bacteroidales bacterium]
MNKQYFIKRTILLLLAAISMTACSNRMSKETTEATQSVIDTVYNDKIPSLQNGDGMLIIGLTDLENEMSADLFRGSYNDSLLNTLMPAGASPSAINVFLAIDSADTILFDAGLGADKGGHLLEQLKKVGVEPSAVTAVCLTHLHADHIGGLLTDGQATFPNAKLYLSKEEFEAWGDHGAMAANNGLWKQVMQAYKGNIVTFCDGERLFDGKVVAESAPGHTPGHTIFVVDSICLIVGDLLHAQDLQLEHPQFCARYDMDPAQAAATRQRILNRLRTKWGWFLAGAHCYEHFIDLYEY